MASDKVVFVAFAIEDQSQRNLLKGQAVNAKCPFEFVDMSAKEPYDSNWKERVRTRIRRSDGVIALVSASTLSSAGEKWEIQCAKEEKKKLIGLWAYSSDRTKPAERISNYLVDLARDCRLYRRIVNTTMLRTEEWHEAESDVKPTASGDLLTPVS